MVVSPTGSVVVYEPVESVILRALCPGMARHKSALGMGVPPGPVTTIFTVPNPVWPAAVIGMSSNRML
jgi:hypothetical protein